MQDGDTRCNAGLRRLLVSEGFSDEEIRLQMPVIKGCVNHHNCRTYTHLHDLRKETNHARHGKLQDVVSTEMFDHAHRKISAALNLVARHFCEDVHSAGGAAATVQEQHADVIFRANCHCACDDHSLCMQGRAAARSLSGAPLTSSRHCLLCVTT